MALTSILVMAVLLVAFGTVWAVLYYLFTPRLDNPDGIARLTGDCGDTMEIGFVVEGGEIGATHCWTDGCSMSRQCVEAAVRLIQGQTIDGAKNITMIHIIDEIGRVPETHLHCALLAENTVHRACQDYEDRSADRQIEQLAS